MERKFIGWLFIILCAQVLSSLALEIISTTRDTGLDLPTHLMQEQQEQEVNGVNGTTGLHGESDGRGYVLKEAKVYLRRGQKGKGSYGGANVVHRRPRTERSAASLPKKPPFFLISTAILYAGFCLVLVFPF